MWSCKCGTVFCCYLVANCFVLSLCLLFVLKIRSHTSPAIDEVTNSPNIVCVLWWSKAAFRPTEVLCEKMQPSHSFEWSQSIDVLQTSLQCFGVCKAFKHIKLLLKLDFLDRITLSHRLKNIPSTQPPWAVLTQGWFQSKSYITVSDPGGIAGCLWKISEICIIMFFAHKKLDYKTHCDSLRHRQTMIRPPCLLVLHVTGCVHS